jgi:hypothetical protein
LPILNSRHLDSLQTGVLVFQNNFRKLPAAHCQGELYMARKKKSHTAEIFKGMGGRRTMEITQVSMICVIPLEGKLFFLLSNGRQKGKN